MSSSPDKQKSNSLRPLHLFCISSFVYFVVKQFVTTKSTKVTMFGSLFVPRTQGSQRLFGALCVLCVLCGLNFLSVLSWRSFRRRSVHALRLCASCPFSDSLKANSTNSFKHGRLVSSSRRRINDSVSRYPLSPNLVCRTIPFLSITCSVGQYRVPYRFQVAKSLSMATGYLIPSWALAASTFFRGFSQKTPASGYL